MGCACGIGLRESGGQRVDEAGVGAEPREQIADAVEREVEGSGSPQQADRAQHGHEVGQQIARHLETLLRAFDKGLVDGHLAQRAGQQKGQHHRQQRQVADKCRHR